MESPPLYRCNACGKQFSDLTEHVLYVDHGQNQFKFGIFGKNEFGKTGYKSIQFPTSFSDVRTKLIKTDTNISVTSDLQLKYIPNINAIDDANSLDFTLPASTMFSSPEERQTYVELVQQLPDVVKELSKEDIVHTERLKMMFKLIGDGTFPFDNIAYLLFEDVVNWFSCEDIRTIKYTKQD